MSVNVALSYFTGKPVGLSKGGIRINKLQKKLKRLLGRDCKECGTRRRLEFAHVKKTKLCGIVGRGKSKRMYDIKNNLNCYILLCRSCHRKFDLKHNYRHVRPVSKHKGYYKRYNAVNWNRDD